MKLYLDNLIPRLKEFSLNLDKQEVFIDKQWVIIDENLNKQTYIFRRNGDLLMSLNGQVNIGKWEYISAAKSLLIDRINDKILLNQCFIDPAIMVLKKDGVKEDNFIMANEYLIPDLDILKYLKKLYNTKYEIRVVNAKDLGTLELSTHHEKSGTNINKFTKVSLDGEPVPNGKYKIENSNRIFLIKNSRVFKILELSTYKTNKGNLVIEREYYTKTICTGDFVFQNNEKAPNGKYRIDIFDCIIVENGIITKKTYF